MIYTLQETAKKVVECWEVVNPMTQYQQTNSPHWSSYTSLKNKWRELIKDQSILHQNCPEDIDVGLSWDFKGYVTTLLRYDKSNYIRKHG